MRTIAIINQKGGVGKTTTAVNLGAALAGAGSRVLLIDLDPQAHLTMHLGVESAGPSPGTYHLLTQSLPVEQVTQQVGRNLDIIASCIGLAAAEIELISVIGREVILRDLLLTAPQQWDFILMDCPPSLGILTLNGLAAVDEVFIPLQPHFLALQGMGKLLETVQLTCRRLNADIRVTGIALCMYESATRLAAEVVQDLESFLLAARQQSVPWQNAQIFRTRIRRNIRLAESAGYGQAIFDYAPASRGARDYAALAQEVLAMSTSDQLTTAPDQPAAAGAPSELCEPTAGQTT